MNRTEFVQTLRRSLSGKMSYQEVNEHIEYYENYFDTELAHGKTEREMGLVYSALKTFRSI